jgi:hypothetical protein
MKVDLTTKALLLLIGLGLWAVAFAQFLAPGPAQADADDVMKVDVNIAQVGGRDIPSGRGLVVEGPWTSLADPIPVQIAD